MKPFFLLLLIGLVGCAHVARKYTAPDATKLTEASTRLGQKVTEARATNARASAAITAAKQSSDKETALLDAIGPKVNDLLRVSPVELRPEIEAIQSQVTALATTHRETLEDLATGQKEQSTLTGQLEEATAAKNDVAKYSPAYLAQVDELAKRANTAEQGWAKDSKELVQLKVHSLLYRVLGFLALVALIGLAFLYFTGRLTLSAASVASKLP